MPLSKSCSMATFYKAVEGEKGTGKPLRQALAIAYSHLKKVCGVDDSFQGTPSEIVHKGGGSSEGLGEELWPSVAGANEVRKFYHKADEATIKKFEELYAGGKLIDAIRVMEKVLGIEFAPFASNVVTKFLEWYAKPKDNAGTTSRLAGLSERLKHPKGQRSSKLVERLRRISKEVERRPMREFVRDEPEDNEAAEVIGDLVTACRAAIADLSDDELYMAHKTTIKTLEDAVKKAEPWTKKTGIRPWKPGTSR